MILTLSAAQKDLREIRVTLNLKETKEIRVTLDLKMTKEILDSLVQKEVRELRVTLDLKEIKEIQSQPQLGNKKNNNNVLVNFIEGESGSMY